MDILAPSAKRHPLFAEAKCQVAVLYLGQSLVAWMDLEVPLDCRKEIPARRWEEPVVGATLRFSKVCFGLLLSSSQSCSSCCRLSLLAGGGTPCHWTLLWRYSTCSIKSPALVEVASLGRLRLWHQFWTEENKRRFPEIAWEYFNYQILRANGCRIGCFMMLS